MTKVNSDRTRKGQTRCRSNGAPGARLRDGERIIRRFVLNQPSGRLGLEPGWFRNTFTGQEHERMRVNVLLWRRGRVYFEDSGDQMPVCKSNDGLRPSPLIETPKSVTCGHWNGSGWFVRECSLAAWRFFDGRRCQPLCQETWNFLGILEDDGLPFWISLKGTSLRSARRFLSMCYEVTRAGKHDMLDCCITLSSQRVQGRNFEYYVICFSDPQWLAKRDSTHRKLKQKFRRLGQAHIQAAFDAEQSNSAVPAETI